MGRRELIALPGIAAFAATSALGQTATASGAASVSKKAIAKHSGLKATYKVPKSAAKLTKYLNSLSALLTLTVAQQQMAQAIFTSAGSVNLSLRTSMKAARGALSQSVKNNDSGGISQAAATLGSLTAQHTANGASANAAFYQLLTSDQQAKLAQFQG
jgi:Spy/CpxP family protein refolding chaperone